MQTNDQWFNCRMDEATHTKLIRLAEKSGRKKSAVVRMLIHGTPIVEMPPADYHRMTKEMYSIGNNMNQIAKLANATGRIDAQAFSRTVVWLRDVIQEIERTIHARHVGLPATKPQPTQIQKKECE